ncbi:glycoside hydrolase domain-containing protein [Clostridium sardiniense]|uniref:glycoside hydrolase domain-containing protein n=1 Tax=Clostridium sardiniense TaxID=29369 RepID=UPI00195909CA|nr:glycoside hydrolase domain-containing protein [Clostridium sardiniense]MBM7834384.1 hypothetical protein [Clostridium sardiniense]
MRRKRGISWLLLFVLSFVVVLENLGISVYATTNNKSDEMSLINDMTIEGDSNKFSYYGDGWSYGDTNDSINGAGDEHFNDINTNDTTASTKYYKIEFVGNKIEVYGHKSWNHGIVSYSIDGGEAIEVSSYSENRVGNQLLFSAYGLSEGKHTLTAISTGKSDSPRGKAVIQVDYAKVYHKRYQVEDIKIENNNIELMEGAEIKILYSSIPSYAEISDIKFTSNNKNIATVDKEGKIKAISEGETNISVVSEEFGISKDIRVKVKASTPSIHGSIVDTNTHYTQDKYDLIKSMGLVNKNLYSWKSDKTISELALISRESKLKNVNVKVSDFVSGENVLSKTNVTTTFLKETKAYIGDAGYHDQNDISMPNGEKADVPDILYTTDPVDIEFNKVQPVWVEFNIPKDTQAGIYTGTIEVTADGINDPLIFTYNIEVLDAIMPNSEEYEFDIEMWQYPYSSAEYYNVTPFSEEHFRILKPHMLKYKEMGGHAITTSIVEEAWGGQTYSKNDIRYPSMIKWTKKSNGKFTFDFTNFDKWVQFNKDLGIGDKIICYSMIPWGNKIYYYNESTGNQENIILNPGTSDYEVIWTQFLNDLIPHLDEKGWFEDTYIGIDERRNMDKAFDVIDKVKNKDGLILKKAAAMDHFNANYFNITKRVDDLSVGSTAAKTDLDGYRKFVKERRNSEKEYKTTIYTCTEHFPNSLALSMPGESYWTMLFTAAQGATGYMRWAYDAWVEDPLRDTTHWAFEAGDTSLIYPDEKDIENPVSKSSVRLEKMAEGVRDVNKLYHMVKEIPGLQSDVEKLLKTVRVDYTGVKNGVGDHGGAKFATSQTREEIPRDMENLREGIKNISKKYIDIKKNVVDRVDSIKEKRLVDVVKADYSESNISSYDFNNIIDNKVVDQWGEHDGVLEGAEIIDGKVGKALQFNNSSDNVTITSPATLSEDWTLAMWVKKGDIKNLPASIMWDGNEFKNGDKETESIDVERDNSGNMGVHVKQGFLTFKNTIPENEWIHLAWVNNKSEGLRIYIDGVSTEVNSWTKNNSFNAPLKIIGGRNYIGAIDEVKVYNRALSKKDVDEIRKVPGLNIVDKSVEVMVNETSQIVAELVSDNSDKTIKYISDNPEVATVTPNGLITGVAYGDTFITVVNEATGFSKRVDVRVNKKMNIGFTIPQYNYDSNKQIVIDREAGQYLGQPDMILLDDNKTLFTVYPKGHGLGEVLLKKSNDGGITWSERLETNSTWKESMETPTIYKLNLTDGSTKLIQISGGPGWGNGFRGWTTSISDNQGESWSDYKKWHEGSTTIVAMASLVQLKDENGNFIDKWMGVYHDYGYVNYKTYLTFDELGNEVWSKPEPYLSEWRDVEKETQLCEVGMLRSPDGNQLVMLARSQSHRHKSTIAFSKDEGDTWSKPREVQGALNGERHKISYDPISGRLLITFREIILDYNNNSVIENNDWMAGDWIAWVGTYDDLINGNEGEYRIRLAEDFTPTAKSGDCGYAGNVVLQDGTFVLNSYGNWDKNDKSNNPYIIGVRLKLGEIDNALGFVDKDELLKEINKSENLDKNLYTSDSWLSYMREINKAKEEINRNDIQQIEIDNLVINLKNEAERLVLKSDNILFTNIINIKKTGSYNSVK